jgi:hypothetical protein
MNGTATPEPTEASAPTPQPPLDWRFSQVFGERGAGEDVQDGTDPTPLLLLAFGFFVAAAQLDLTASLLPSWVRG